MPCRQTLQARPRYLLSPSLPRLSLFAAVRGSCGRERGTTAIRPLVDVDGVLRLGTLRRQLGRLWALRSMSFRDRRSILAMPRLIRALSADLGDAPVFYLTALPMGLARPITNLLIGDGYPSGTRCDTESGAHGGCGQRPLRSDAVAVCRLVDHRDQREVDVRRPGADGEHERHQRSNVGDVARVPPDDPRRDRDQEVDATRACIAALAVMTAMMMKKASIGGEPAACPNSAMGSDQRFQAAASH